MALADRVFRLSDRHRLIAHARLPAAERRRLGADACGEEFPAVLLPTGGADPPKLVSRQSLAFLRALRRPRHLPAGVRRMLRADPAALARLVLDRVLELRDGTTYLSGPSAVGALGVARPESPSRTRLGRLALDALLYAQQAGDDPPVALADRLYFYNRAPVSPAWAERLADEHAVAAFLGLGRGRPAGQLLRSGWWSSRTSANGWLGWSSRRRRSADALYKLYVSIDLADLEAAFPAVVAVASAERVPALKVASDVYGLHRPDKLVLYTATHRDVARLGGRLRTALSGARPQGAPFSAALDADGLLSWGLDPVAPVAERAASWRRDVTLRLAFALASARADVAGTAGFAPWEYALARVALEGIDTVHWQPGRPEMSHARQ